MRRNLAMGTLAVACIVLGVWATRGGEGGKTKPLGPQELLVQEVRQLRAEVKNLQTQLKAIQAEQVALNRSVALLVQSPWEYRLESFHGGNKREKLAELLDKMGKKGFEYQNQTASGLYVFRRRLVEGEAASE